MPNRVRIVTVTDADRVKLERQARDRGAPARVAERARIVLLAADGLTGPQIAGRVGCTEPTVVKWRRQYAEGGPAGPEDAPRPGGPRPGLNHAAAAEVPVATGQVTDACYPRHRHQEFLRFLKKTAAAYPGTGLHVICDNYATHKHPEVQAWLARNPRVTLHFTPTGCSWINLVECFFSVITRQAIRRGSFTSVRQLTDTIGAYIGNWNDPRARSPGPRTPTRSSTASNSRRLKQALLQSTSCYARRLTGA